MKYKYNFFFVIKINFNFSIWKKGLILYYNTLKKNNFFLEFENKLYRNNKFFFDKKIKHSYISFPYVSKIYNNIIVLFFNIRNMSLIYNYLLSNNQGQLLFLCENYLLTSLITLKKIIKYNDYNKQIFFNIIFFIFKFIIFLYRYRIFFYNHSFIFFFFNLKYNYYKKYE